jgi:nitrite reductase/ring-hydroxylating ferredoxin subunit/uncharacterized membrane protein
MLPHAAATAVGHQEWLDPISDSIQTAVSEGFERAGVVGQTTKDFLHGVWLGHALHPVLTDVPIGAWTVTTVLDVIEGVSGRHDLAPGADASLAVGLVGAAGAAATGLTDWSATDGEARRIGMLHGLLNVGVTGLYLASLLARRRGHRSSGRRLAFLGYGVSMVSAYLGGHLIAAERLSVDHADVGDAPRQFTPVLPAGELRDGQPHRVEVNGVPVVLVRRGEQIFALADRCAHLGGPLSEGDLVDDTIRCPWHGSRFALDSGCVLDGPSALPQPRFDARVRDGQIEVRRAEETARLPGNDASATELPAPGQADRLGDSTAWPPMTAPEAWTAQETH